MTDNFVQLNKDDVLRLEIRTDKGEPTGEFFFFFLEDIELPLRYQDMIEKDRKNKEYLQNQLVVIGKRQDVKGKKLLSKNEEDKIRAINDFLNKEKEVYNMFLGEHGVEKLLNGRKLSISRLLEIDEIAKKQIAPKLNFSMEKITDKIKKTYGKNKQEEIEVLE